MQLNMILCDCHTICQHTIDGLAAFTDGLIWPYDGELCRSIALLDGGGGGVRARQQQLTKPT